MHDDAVETANSLREALRYLLTDAEEIKADLVSLHIRLAITEVNAFVDHANKRRSSSSK